MMRQRFGQMFYVATGLVGFSLWAPTGYAAEYFVKDGAPKRGPSSVWRLVQQPTSLGIGSCAQAIIDNRAAGQKPLWIPYHGWKERHSGRMGYPPSPWSTLGGLTYGSECSLPQVQTVQEVPVQPHCPTCVTRDARPEANGTGASEIPNPGAAHDALSTSSNPIRRASYQSAQVETGPSGYSTDSTPLNSVPYELGTQGASLPNPPQLLGSDGAITGRPQNFSPSTSTLPISGGPISAYYGVTNGMAATAMKPGTAQLIVDCDPKMKLTIYRGKDENMPGNTLRSSGSRRIIECTGLEEDGTFGYLLRGDLGGHPWRVEHVAAYDSYPTVPRVFEPQPSKRGGKVWVGVRSGDRVHIRFETMDASPPVNESIDARHNLPANTDLKPPCETTKTQEAAKDPACHDQSESNTKESYSYSWAPIEAREPGDVHRLYAQIRYDDNSVIEAAHIKDFFFWPLAPNNQPKRVTPKTLKLTAKGLTKDSIQPHSGKLMAQMKYQTESSLEFRDGHNLDLKLSVSFRPLAQAFGTQIFEVEFLPQKQVTIELLNGLKQYDGLNSQDPVKQIQLQFSIQYPEGESALINPPLVIQIVP